MELILFSDKWQQKAKFGIARPCNARHDILYKVFSIRDKIFRAQSKSFSFVVEVPACIV